MPLGLNEIRARAAEFARSWEGATKENANAQTFWNELFEVFGKKRRQVAVFEMAAERLGGTAGGRIDLFWPGLLIAEHKSAGRDLDEAYTQAMEYLAGGSIRESEMPRYVLVSDFARIRIYDLEYDSGNEDYEEFLLEELPQKVRKLSFIAGYRQVTVKEEDPINVKAVRSVGRLHDALVKTSFSGHELEVLLVRLVFCFFADDTRIFDNDTFRLFILNQTNDDGANLGAQLSFLFQILNTPKNKRQKTLSDDIAELPYIDGHLFEEATIIPVFSREMRDLLIECTSFDWSTVSPAIFGSMFQSVMNEDQRHDLGAHYTSEKNILKLIGPLFLDGLKDELEKAGTNKKKLHDLQDKMAKLTFLDPACGCGNFLVVSYRELRRIEMEVLGRLHSSESGATQTTMLNMGTLSRIDVDCMYGIEIEEFPARIAELALWLTDHQMNMELGDKFGVYYARLPLNKRPNIHHKNALTTDWETVVPKEKLSYILGNPPFLGHHLQSVEQKNELNEVLHNIPASGVMDFVSAWYVKAAEYIQGTMIEVAFVSTNSISQGEQVGILWGDLLLPLGIKINFAHRTFKWSNEATGRAAVYCVIIGFSLRSKERKWLYEYEKVAGEPHALEVKTINPYLVDAANIIVRNRTNPISDVPGMTYGSKPSDGGNFILSENEKTSLLTIEPQAAKYIRRYMSGEDFLHDQKRYCIWLVGVAPDELKKLPEIMKRVELVKNFRAASRAPSTRNYGYHSLFRQLAQPDSDYILVPSTTSETRRYIPFGFLSKDIILSNASFAIPGATLYHFGILESEMHMTWVRTVCGRLKSDFRYSKDIVYNNFPWPENASEKDKLAVETAAQAVLDARKEFPNSTLADLYNPITMPPKLVKAHQNLDKAVDKCYGKKGFSSESERLEFLFAKYKEIIERQ